MPDATTGFEDAFLGALAPFRWGYDLLTGNPATTPAESALDTAASGLGYTGGSDSDDSDSSSWINLSWQSWGLIAVVLVGLLLILLITKSVEDVI